MQGLCGPRTRTRTCKLVDEDLRGQGLQHTVTGCYAISIQHAPIVSQRYKSKVMRTCIAPFMKLQLKALRYGSHRIAPANYTIPASALQTFARWRRLNGRHLIYSSSLLSSAADMVTWRDVTYLSRVAWAAMSSSALSVSSVQLATDRDLSAEQFTTSWWTVWLLTCQSHTHRLRPSAATTVVSQYH